MGEVVEEDDAQAVFDFYVELVENHRERVVYYLAENAVLDWFGQTVKGATSIGSFVKSHMTSVRHFFSSPSMVESIGYRDSHTLPPISEPRKTLFKMPLPSAEITPPDLIISNHNPRMMRREAGQGDGPHNDDETVSPPKRLRTTPDVVDTETTPPPKVKYVRCDGCVQFAKKSSKKLQPETKWSRPSKLEFAYTGTLSDCTLHMIIYEGNVKCRRNLLKDFEKSMSKE